MIFRFFLFSLLFTSLLVSCENEVTDQNSASVTSTDSIDTTSLYDEQLAQKLGADEYGMTTYVMAFLKRGPNRSQDSLEAARLQRAHLDNIGKMAEEGKLVVAGPFLDDNEIRGIYIFNVKTVEEARQLTATDPAIKAGRLEMELHPWYGPASLNMTMEISEKITKTDI